MKIVKIAPIYVIFLVMAISGFSQPTDNVISYYPFNRSAIDVTGNGKDCSVSGSTLTSDRLGKTNAAYSFNGTNNLIYLPNVLLSNPSAFAFSCWIKPGGNNFSPDVLNAQTIIDLRGQYQIAPFLF
ncbi:MAG: hypothetical protein HC905_06140 [Bacteroidales bacterium]|nr:hypothetical protein [Bacteroidales bacterium]